ncbi:MULTISPECIES: hypothetical protein [unclassified Prevotella]|uniref:hypothetical protein n=1 Tax=unclassified Prevotella TaxID=2638335 RepID=UPI000CEA48FE|nr:MULTISPECIES: hypothetical protein [unclassified Prevotella]NPD55400.1 hypothetical protein [Prevotella sp. PTAC]
MKKLILLTLLLLLITPCLRAQRKEMSQARSYIKSGKELEKAEKMMTELLAKDSVCRTNPKIYLLLYQALQKQYEVGNEKLYLKQKYDTAAIFNLTKRMFTVLETLDSIDAIPDKKGRVVLEYRRKHASELNTLRPNLFYGGTYYIRKTDYKTAFDFFSTYIECDRKPLFSGYDYQDNDKRMTDAAYWATYCGFKMNNPEKTLMYADTALHNISKKKYTLRFIAEAYKAEKKDAQYVQVLRTGFKEYPEYPYFLSRLMDYYTNADSLNEALLLADKALAVDSDNELFMLAKSTVLLNIGKYDDCISLSDSLIQKNDTLPEPYFNAGTAYLNKILILERDKQTSKNKKQIKNLYKKARPYLEKYREYAPDNKDKWGHALYRIYLNLNMGKQFDEIDKILKN